MKSTVPLKRSPMKPGKGLKNSPLARLAINAGARANGLTPDARPRRLKAKQRAVTDAEKLYWDRLATVIGCVACLVAGRNPRSQVSIHHIDGRTKEGCHRLVLPLCAGCHQQGTGNDPTLVAVHPYKARFEAMYGTQMELKALCDTVLDAGGLHRG